MNERVVRGSYGFQLAQMKARADATPRWKSKPTVNPPSVPYTTALNYTAFTRRLVSLYSGPDFNWQDGDWRRLSIHALIDLATNVGIPMWLSGLNALLDEWGNEEDVEKFEEAAAFGHVCGAGVAVSGIGSARDWDAEGVWPGHNYSGLAWRAEFDGQLVPLIDALGVPQWVFPHFCPRCAAARAAYIEQSTYHPWASFQWWPNHNNPEYAEMLFQAARIVFIDCFPFALVPLTAQSWDDVSMDPADYWCKADELDPSDPFYHTHDLGDNLDPNDPVQAGLRRQAVIQGVRAMHDGMIQNISLWLGQPSTDWILYFNFYDHLGAQVYVDYYRPYGYELDEGFGIWVEGGNDGPVQIQVDGKNHNWPGETDVWIETAPAGAPTANALRLKKIMLEEGGWLSNDCETLIAPRAFAYWTDLYEAPPTSDWYDLEDCKVAFGRLLDAGIGGTNTDRGLMRCPVSHWSTWGGVEGGLAAYYHGPCAYWTLLTVLPMLERASGVSLGERSYTETVAGGKTRAAYSSVKDGVSWSGFDATIIFGRSSDGAKTFVVPIMNGAIFPKPSGLILQSLRKCLPVTVVPGNPYQYFAQVFADSGEAPSGEWTLEGGGTYFQYHCDVNQSCNTAYIFVWASAGDQPPLTPTVPVALDPIQVGLTARFRTQSWDDQGVWFIQWMLNGAEQAWDATVYGNGDYAYLLYAPSDYNAFTLAARARDQAGQVSSWSPTATFTPSAAHIAPPRITLLGWRVRMAETEEE